MYEIANTVAFPDKESAAAFVSEWNAENKQDPIQVVTRKEFERALLDNYRTCCEALARHINEGVVVQMPSSKVRALVRAAKAATLAAMAAWLWASPLQADDNDLFSAMLDQAQGGIYLYAG